MTFGHHPCLLSVIPQFCCSHCWIMWSESSVRLLGNQPCVVPFCDFVAAIPTGCLLFLSGALTFSSTQPWAMAPYNAEDTYCLVHVVHSCLAILLQSALGCISWVLYFSTLLQPGGPALLSCMGWTLVVCTDWTFLCLLTFDTFFLSSQQSFTLFLVCFILFLLYSVQLSLSLHSFLLFMSGSSCVVWVYQSNWLARLLIGWRCLGGLLASWMDMYIFVCLFVCLFILCQQGSSVP